MIDAKTPRQGDLIFVKTNHFVSRLIRFGQRSYGKEAAQWNHVAIYVGDRADGTGACVVEALTSGVQRSPLSKYKSNQLKLVHINIEDIRMRYNAAQFANSCVGEKYGFVTIFAIALKTLFKGHFNFGVQGTSICSGLAARSLERMGYNWNPYDPAELTPAYLVKELS
jgi:uncharacterized protein YycO